MIIGLSGGDIYLGIKLLKDTLQALSNTKGSQKQYLDAVKQLETLELCLKVAQCKISDLNADNSRSVVARAVSECAGCIESYQKEILCRYETFFGEEREHSARRKFTRELKKVQWLHEKEKTEALSKAIASHIQIITLACSIESLSRGEGSVRIQSELSHELAKVIQPVKHPSDVTREHLPWGDSNVGEAQLISDPSLKGKSRIVIDELVRDSALSMATTSHETKQVGRNDLPEDTARIPDSATPSAIKSFSRPPSLITSASRTATSISAATTISSLWVDEAGICQNPSCQRRTYLQKKTFALYAHLTHRSTTAGMRDETGIEVVRRKPTCEHTLLYLQTMTNSYSSFGGAQH